MQIDLTTQGWLAFVNAVLMFIAILIPQTRAWFGGLAEDYQRAVRGIASLVLAVAFIGGSCAGWWNDLACERSTILSFVGNVVIASVVGFQASGALMAGVKTSQASALTFLTRNK